MEIRKYRILYACSMIVGLILIFSGLLLWIPRSTRSDTPDMYYYQLYCLRLLLPIAGVLLMVIGSSVYSSCKALYREIRQLKDNVREPEKKISG